MDTTEGAGNFVLTMEDAGAVIAGAVELEEVDTTEGLLGCNFFMTLADSFAFSSVISV